MTRKAKPPPPTPGEVWRRQQRAIRHTWNDPRLRALLDEARKTAEAGRNLLSPQAREIVRLMREQREVLRRLGIGDEPPLPPSPLQLPSPPPAREKTRRGRPVVLTNDEIAAGVTIVRRENAEYQKQYGRQVKQTEAFRPLRRQVTRDGKPLTISDATWRRWVVKPALDPE